MKEPLVSVVTPIHNTAAYLDECIESVRRQTYANWEYVLLDNASSDGSTEIARRHAAQDSRIRLVRRDDLVPQVPNYNRAIAQASPECRYVKMLEADNWLYPECLQKMVALAEAHPNVGIVSSYNVTETRIRLAGLPLADTVIDGREAARAHLRADAYWFGAPTTVLMRGDLVRATQPFYDEGHLIAEDLSACFDALLTTDFGFVHQILTFVRTQNDSILSKIKGFDAQDLDRLVLLRRHGADFFSPQEMRAVERRLTRQYYGCLARGVLRRQTPAYWQFHRRGLASSGLRLEPVRLAGAVLRRVVSPG